MKKKIFSTFLIAAVLMTTINFWTPRQFAKENNEVANLALMLPESDVIVAVDMDKTLNVVGPNLLNQDSKKIENLKKLMKSFENVIGINPYEINQIVAGVKLPSVEEKDYLNNIDFTVIFRTAHSNNALLEEWSKKIDAIEAFNDEREPTEKYMDAFKSFRSYKLSKDETEKITKLNKEFEELLKKTNAVNISLGSAPATAKTAKSYKDALKKNKGIADSINSFQEFLKKDADVKSLRESSVKLQNRWYEVALEDPKRGEKFAAILKEAKEIYPTYKIKAENLSKIDALINISNWEFYDRLSKKSFGLPNDDDYKKDPNEMMKEKLEKILDTLATLSTVKAKQTNQLNSISKDLQRLDDAMTIRLKRLDEIDRFDEISESTPTTKSTKTLSQSIKENAKISEVNGKRLITINLEKISFWNPGFETEDEIVVKPAEAKPETEVNKDTSKEPKVVEPPTKIGEVKTEPIAKDKKGEPVKEEKKKELFAIGYLDDRTMVLGFENGIRTILNRKEDYKNPKAAEMLNSFKNPLVSFATNSKVFQNFMKGYESPTEKKEEKKVTPTDKFFNDINVFGSIEYDGDSATANDLIMSLGFTKSKVEEVFKVEDDEEGSSVFEVGDYQISKAIFYDLLNTLKAFKASISFKFEKQKVAALIESSPQIIEDIRFNKTKRQRESAKAVKTKVQNIQNLEDLLTSPKFYTDLFGIITNKVNK